MQTLLDSPKTAPANEQNQSENHHSEGYTKDLAHEKCACGNHAALTSRELSDLVDLLLASSTQEQTQFVLEKPRQAIAQSSG